MPHLNDLAYDSLVNTWTENDEGSANSILTVIHAAAAARRHAVMKADASYSSSTASGLLRVLFGTTVMARKYIHGAGAIDLGSMGLLNPDANEAVSADLAAGGAGVTGTIVLSGYSTDGSI